ncbi:NUDIX hydrolase [Bifidobacterium cuniculi]|uniref:Nudix hydrolase family protein n=1 Tax=Bifidobacterium cuniculi TaxID=1688 RepID=A0A087B3H5_9BIFI|nr:NUDIX domain-containing protein [Bifidobacterium cuniculi]KFI65575.1 Nudix hydrolase family protein [Bifidobacterium cuniculi]
MPTPEFILELRDKVGHAPLWLMGVSGCIVRDDGMLLLEQRADNGKWALVSGIVEPGEDPADTLVREAMEETGLAIEVTDLVAVKSDHELMTYPNGDRTWYMDHLFLAQLADGADDEPRVADDESTSVGWFAPGDLPVPVTESSVQRIAAVRDYLRHRAAGNAHAQFTVDGADRFR